MGKSSVRTHGQENERRIKANNREYNAQFRYANNYIKTSKYSIITFLPLNLLEQFQRLANFYFLCLLVLQLIPAISSLTPITTAIPLIGVLALTAVKDAYDDFQRHQNDSQVNHRRAKTLRNGKLVEEKWASVQVGDVIRLENDQFVAADILLLSSSEPNGLCYIETAELDGETNLKCRQCLLETAAMSQDDAQLGAFDGEIVCETPNNLLNKFEGTLSWRGQVFSLDNDKILLRGCVLRNTSWCYGVVVFAGKDTKLMQNSGKTKFKRTSIDRLLNFLIIGIVFFLLSMCVFCTIACGVWEWLIGQHFQVYLPWDSLVPAEPASGSVVIAFLVFFSYAIVMNTVVPISLYVSVEVIRFAQSFLINWDEKMYYEKTGTAAKARTTTLNEELGQIQYIFSDKTGTLTQNIMTFNKCSIAGVCYGDVVDEQTGEAIELNERSRSRLGAGSASRARLLEQEHEQGRSTPGARRPTDARPHSTQPLDFSFNPEHEPEFKFFDESLLQAVQRGDQPVHDFFRLLALCHTVMPDQKNGRLEYQVGFSFNPEHEPDFKFFDESLLQAVQRGDQPVHDFFRLLALCHTVMPDQKNGRLEYQVGFSFNPEHEPEFKFFDESLLQAVQRGDQPVHDFFRLLALCHTVMPDQKNGRLEYQVGFSFNPEHEPEFKFFDESLLQAVQLGDQPVHDFFRLLALCHIVMPDQKNGRLEYQVGFSFNPEHEPEFKFFDESLLQAVQRGDQPVHDIFRLLAVCHTVMPDQKNGRLEYQIGFSFNPEHEPEFKFFDKSLLQAVQRGDQPVHDFFRLLALCHTVMPDQKNGRLMDQAQSPDESALVSAARNFGFVFRERAPNSITIEVMGKTEVYELLCILDFNNVRKRMSVILRKDGEIRLYTKGADNVIYERLKGNTQEGVKTRTQEHLNKFAGEGLRTLALAWRPLDERGFAEWKRRHHTAALALRDRDEQLDAIYEEIETDLLLLGVTAIEDKLQDGVPETIANLSMAGIKIWVLTGDKQETAINIGYSCQLLTDDMAEVFVIDGIAHDDVDRQLAKCRDSIRVVNTFLPAGTPGLGGGDAARNGAGRSPGRAAGVKLNAPAVSVVTFSNEYAAGGPATADSHEHGNDDTNGFAIVINGHSLVHCLHPKLEDQFLEVVLHCRSVICCRVTPLQKAMVVELIKKARRAVTLAIGDGANDVSMIKAAHIGVGISGQEGMQAVLAADYSIAQFCFLQRLLLVHGRWSYYRMCKFLRYFFYKNFAFTVCHFWFAFFCGFSAQTVFDEMFISVYNLFYTSLPVLALGVFEQDVSDATSLQFPKLYAPGHTSQLFNKTEFIKSTLHGCFTSLVLFLIPYGTYKDGLAPDGKILSDHMLLGSVVATILIIDNTTQIALDTTYWTVCNHVTIWGSLVSYFVLDYFYNYAIGGPYVGSLTVALTQATFWFTAVLTMMILMVPVVSWRLACSVTRPTLAERLRARQRWREAAPAPRTPSARRVRRSMRSGYAFAHQEGFGRLITSGKIMRRIPHVDAALHSLAALPGKFSARPGTPPPAPASSPGAGDGSPSPPSPPSPRAPKQDLDSVDL